MTVTPPFHGQDGCRNSAPAKVQDARSESRQKATKAKLGLLAVWLQLLKATYNN